MLKIGDFSKLSRVSVRMLRHYDEIGLLKPTKTDKYTNYRYYSEAQLITVCRITALKNMGFSLFDIGNILESYGNKEKLNAFLTVRKNELKALSEETAKKLLLVETAIKRLRKEDIMNYTVTLKTLPERYAACVDITIPKYEDEGIAWQILCEEIKDQKPVPDDPCYYIVVFKDGEYKEQNVSIEAQKTVKGKYKNTEHVKFKVLPPVTFASATFKGGYENISEANAAVAAWIEANGYTYSGTMFNIYHVSPKDTSNPDEYITEVCYPVVKPCKER